MLRILLTLIFLVLTVPAWATNYYISPSGSDSNDGLSAGAPWLTFAKAFGGTGMASDGCGHTLWLANGVYGDGTSTGKISLTSRQCTVTTRLTIQATNERQARINDNGTGVAIKITGTSASHSRYIDLVGLTANSTDNSGSTSNGGPLEIRYSDNIRVYASLFYNPNRWADNNHVIWVLFSQDILIEDVELYKYHSHGITGWHSERVIVRRMYGNPREGGVSGGPRVVGQGNALFSMYPCKDCILENSITDGVGYLNEMNATFGSSIVLSGSKVLGSIHMGGGFANGIYANSRTSAGTNYSPQNITVENVAFVGFSSGSSAIRCTDCVAATFNRITVLGTDVSGAHGITVDATTTGAPIGEQSFVATSNLVLDMGGTAFRNNDAITYAGSNNNSAFSNGTSYSPALAGDWGAGSNTTDPGFGDCKLWLPDGATGAGRGAEILYRYVDGVLTTTPLWDPTTGEWPYRAIVTGINDTASTSLYNVHQRLNVPYSGDTHGCNFPASFPGSTPPQNPAGYTITEEVSGSIAHTRTITAAMDSITVFVMLKDDAGDVGTITGVTGCASEAYTLLGSAVTSPAYRRTYAFGKINPTTGSCTITATGSGTITSAILASVEIDAISAYDDVATCAGLSATPTCTVPTNTSETVIDGVGSKPLDAWTAGTNQTLQLDSYDTFPTPAGDIRGVVSTQSGNNGGVMSHTGPNSYWAQVVVAMLPTSPDPPPSPTPVLNQTKFRFHGLYGTEAAPEVLPHAGAANDINLTTHPIGAVRLRIEVTAQDNTSTPVGLRLYCRKNTDSYTEVQDTFGSNVVRLYGGGVNADIPSSGTASTRLIGANDGNFVAGAVIRAAPTVYTSPSLTTSKHIEMEYALVFNASVGDTIDCRIYRDDGTAINTYTVTPRITIEPASGGFGELWDLLMFTMLPVLGRIESQTAKPESNLAVRYPNVDQVVVEGLACTGLKTSGTGLKRTITCGH